MHRLLAGSFLFIGVVMVLRGLLIDDAVLFGIGALGAVLGFGDLRGWLFGEQGDQSY